MAEKEVHDKPVRPVETKHDEKRVNAPVNKEGALVVVDKHRQAWIIWTVIVGFVVLILLVVAAIVVAHRVTDRTVTTTNQTGIARRGGFGGYNGYQTGSYYQQTSSTDGPTTTTTTTRYTITEGVVTQVNSGNIVVAGNGKTQTITTNSSTTYDNGTKPAVNDTVRIAGTADSSGNVTATEIAVADSDD